MAFSAAHVHSPMLPKIEQRCDTDVFCTNSQYFRLFTAGRGGTLEINRIEPGVAIEKGIGRLESYSLQVR